MRRYCEGQNIFDLAVNPHTKMGVDVARLRREGELERFVRYALRENDADSVFIALDCDDHDAASIVQEFDGRVAALSPARKVVISLFEREFEALFLHGIQEIVAAYPEYGWSKKGVSAIGIPEKIRDAKGQLSSVMASGRAYKPTRDQTKFVSALDLNKLHGASPTYRAFESAMEELLG